MVIAVASPLTLGTPPDPLVNVIVFPATVIADPVKVIFPVKPVSLAPNPIPVTPVFATVT